MDRSAKPSGKKRQMAARGNGGESEKPLTSGRGKSVARRRLLLGSVLLIMTMAAFWGTFSNSFISADDNVYVYENDRVQKGITWDNLKWAFSTNYFGFYYPLTWLSHMLDCQLFGLWAGGHHLTSLLIHLLSTLVLFAFLVRTTSLEWRSFAVAALFAVHPLHVESVAWVAERKDVLCAFFWLSGMLAYVMYVEKPGAARYSLVLFCFVCGLLAKPMIITFPFLLLLLDIWPLHRWTPPFSGRERGPAPEDGAGWKGLSRLLREKTPLFMLVPVFAVITFHAQKHAEAVPSLKDHPFDQRMFNALASYVAYLRKLFFPSDLSAYYPLSDNGTSHGYAIFCGLLLAALTILAVFKGRKHGFWTTGWFWYLGTLVPVIGIVQVGGQAMADRYTYIPLIGIFIVLIWAVSDFAGAVRIPRWVIGSSFSVVMIVLIALTRAQVGYWSDSVTLFNRALAVNPENFFAHNAVGSQYLLRGEDERAIHHLMESVRLDPAYRAARFNLATALMRTGDYAEAAGHYETILNEKPDAAGMSNLGMALAKLGRTEEAVGWLKKAVGMEPEMFDARINLASALSESGRLKESEEHYRKALSLEPGSAPALNGYGQLLMKSGRRSMAITEFRKAVAADKGSFSARTNLAAALAEEGDLQEAADQYNEALAVRPEDPQTLNALGLVLARSGKIEEAASAFRKAVEKAPEVAEARINLGYALLKLGEIGEAEEQFSRALQIDPRSELARMNLLEARRLKNRK
ncbi:MAG TPA: tetratricopeptide repeat protein [Acidobacteriota bacterium]|nr:tetratricopeptide repeat protein [Acidobacteriota bacterium]HNT17175.1 tetratricopeptide repeat protein [Acidobacteriota bacterium]